MLPRAQAQRWVLKLYFHDDLPGVDVVKFNFPVIGTDGKSRCSVNSSNTPNQIRFLVSDMTKSSKICRTPTATANAMPKKLIGITLTFYTPESTGV